MKKFLKVFIIVVLVIGVVAGTCVMFFKKEKEKNYTTISFAAMLDSEEKKLFDQDLADIRSYVNSDATDTRFNLIIKTSSKLDEVLSVLSSYYIENDTKINNKKISTTLNQVVSSRNHLSSMMNEYEIKKDTQYFDRHIGANDLYEESCNYLIKYAKLNYLINKSLEGVDKSVDIKFNMFEIYSNVTQQAFSNLKTLNNSRVVVKDETNINLMNSLLVLNNSFISTTASAFSIYVSHFNKYYSLTKKTNFANNLVTNINSVQAITESSTNEQIATYYFKTIFGM